MNARETRTLARTAMVLLAAGAVRWAVDGGAWEPASAAGGDPPPSALAALDSAAHQAARDEARAATPLAEGERLDPNRADVVELQRLPGVGPALARALVEAREGEGPFLVAGDLDRVRGIGPVMVAKLEPYLDFSTPPPAFALGSGAARAPPGPLDLNRAQAEELVRLPGIGPALAERIVESRSRDGAFRSAEDLLRVRGIGPVLLARLRPLVRPGGG